MKAIYIDSDFKCHITNEDGTLTAIEADFFDGKCTEYIEGFRYVPSGSTWTRSDGTVFRGKMIAPWKSYAELDAAQHEYEKQLIQNQAATIAELDAALLDATYNSLITEVE